MAAAGATIALLSAGCGALPAPQRVATVGSSTAGAKTTISGGGSPIASSGASASKPAQAQAEVDARVLVPCTVAERQLQALIRGLVEPGFLPAGGHRGLGLKLKLERDLASAYTIDAATLAGLQAAPASATSGGAPGLRVLIERLQSHLARLASLRNNLRRAGSSGVPVTAIFDVAVAADACRAERPPIGG